MSRNPVDIEALLDEYRRQGDQRRDSNFDQARLDETEAGRQISALSRKDQCRAVVALTNRIWDHGRFFAEQQAASSQPLDILRTPELRARHEINQLDSAAWLTLVKRKLPFQEEQLLLLLQWAVSYQEPLAMYYALPGLTNLCGNFAAAGKVSPAVTEAMQKLVRYLRPLKEFWDLRKRVDQLEHLLVAQGAAEPKLDFGEAWSDRALAELQSLPIAQRRNWNALLLFTQSANGPQPAAKWLKAAAPLIEAVGLEEFRQRMRDWFPLVDQPRTRPYPGREGEGSRKLLLPEHAQILKGLAWCCAPHADEGLTRALAALALSAFKKIPGHGPRQASLGNACVHALSQIPGVAAISQLALLKLKVKGASQQKTLEKALSAAAERAQLPRAEIEELSVPTYGMESVGLRRETFGEHTAELTADGTDVALRWRGPGGKPLKAPPAAVKRDHAEALREFQRAAKEITKMLPAQKERLDGLFLQQTSWSHSVWRKRYLEHPLVGTLARRLIWRIAERSACWSSGQLVGVDDAPLPAPDAEVPVTLWSPLDAPVDEVLAWRDWLERHRLRQPFKQAHREIYLLTDAERTTRVYSNRFAAHILRQHQFKALCDARGWRYRLAGGWDGGGYEGAEKPLPRWNLRAEYIVSPAGQDIASSGIFNYVATDQVCFFRLDDPRRRDGDDRLPLEQIPPLVLSEIFRDVDLFVGVSGVGNDPNWTADPNRPWADYWSAVSFGELSSTARTRADLLKKIIPRLAIAGRCSFVERFLVVRGDLRTYKIHLGSGNILMEPNDQYLCIVPKSRAADEVFLPFEGDSVLSVILSKAFLLAADAKISDPTITSQIQRS